MYLLPSWCERGAAGLFLAVAVVALAWIAVGLVRELRDRRP